MEHILFISFIVSQPIIDIATGFMARYVHGVLTPGAIIRTIILAWMVPYIWNRLRANRRLQIVLVAALSTIALTAVISFVTKDPFLIRQEAVFYMKSMYFAVSILFIVMYVRNPLLPRRQTERAIIAASLITGGSYVIALATNTSFRSYPYGEMGFSGWFFSANELSVITILLFASVVTITRQRRTASAYVALFSLAGMGMLIGTKTAYVGIALLLIVHLFELIITYRKKVFRSKDIWASALLALLFFGAMPLIPATTNSIQNHTDIAHMSGPHVEQLPFKSSVQTSNLLSSRQHYLYDTVRDFRRASLVRKSFGLGYAGDYQGEPKMIEMDLPELLFSYGYVGTIVLLTPLALLSRWLLVRGSFRRQQWVLLAGFALTISIAAVAGHVLFAPSVMSYVVISAALLERRQAKMPRMEKGGVVKMILVGNRAASIDTPN